MNESEDMYRDVEVAPDRNNMELTGLWKYTKYGIRVLGFTRVGWGVISPEVAVQTDEDSKWTIQSFLSHSLKMVGRRVALIYQLLLRQFSIRYFC